MTIKILSNATINKIAAGEVIERPSSVIKELIENSIDAGAAKIEVTLECAGKNLIVIKDNGLGMNKGELELAIQRHATSKLDEDDLLNINSFGFRGEALPSIGAISKFKITSKKRTSDKAYTLSIIGGIIKKITPAICNEGTIIEVRDLFFATPARLKFLRADKTELVASINIIKKIALAHPEISFSLIHDNKSLFKLRGQNGTLEKNIKNRIEEVIGTEFIENASIVSYFRGDIEIFGYTSLPTYNRASGEAQFLFVNNRPVKDKILNIALKVAYQDYLASGRHPVSVFFLKISPHFVDVNVHPAKTEVRFHDPNFIRGTVISAIKNALNSSSGRVSIATATTTLNYMRPATQINKLQEKKCSQTRFQAPIPMVDYALSKTNSQINGTPQSVIEDKNESNMPTPVNFFLLGVAKAQLYGAYIISQTSDSVIITDQHAAHERIVYEKIKQQIEKDGLVKQRLLIPEIVELPDTNRADLINDNKENLKNLALSVEKFGKKSIIVSEIPSLVGDINIQNLICDLADHFSEMGENIALTELIEHVAETYACHYAIRAGRKLKGEEMNELLRQMENTPFFGQCNHGRQTYIELKLVDIEKLFGRR